MREALALVLLSALVACGSAGKGGVRAGDAAPQWSDPLVNGTTFSYASLKGSPVYLNFFASWCPPCNVEAPGIETLQQRYASRGLHVIGIDEEENASTARGFAQKYHLTYPIVVDSDTLENLYHVNGLPVHVFIRRDGTIYENVAGEMSQAEIAAAVKAIL